MLSYLSVFLNGCEPKALPLMTGVGRTNPFPQFLRVFLHVCLCVFLCVGVCVFSLRDRNRHASCYGWTSGF